tara:strand:+ start:3316 stop:3576 length:261 start_codon:yes stop_codon:yes gene_type:complete
MKLTRDIKTKTKTLLVLTREEIIALVNQTASEFVVPDDAEVSTPVFGGIHGDHEESALTLDCEQKLEIRWEVKSPPMTQEQEYSVA